ncbi:hypothetical protein NBRC111894_3111 [Sporolactobacillus inulinus]|uniref:Uncharacterized protein n=1 Tax=Sporolactobacillus inulinus TaxID=2078 RepID=A0A4Y1ZEK8_9BACL|nr:hypothetical protein NBRC111894_3111 [Sporolactobacillus inulinus]
MRAGSTLAARLTVSVISKRIDAACSSASDFTILASLFVFGEA